MSIIENRTYDEMKIGDTATLVRTLSQKDIHLFAIMSGDVNPAHVDEEFASNDMFHAIIAHGMWGGALISTVLGTQLPGPGTIYLGQSLRFLHPVYPGDTVTVTVTVAEMEAERHRVSLECKVINQHHKAVIVGTAEVIAPTEKIARTRIELPAIHIPDVGRRYRDLIALTQKFEPVRTAVVHPVDAVSLLSAIKAAEAQLIIPVFVGPRQKILTIAAEGGIDLTPYQLIPTDHSHAAAAKAVAMARTGEVQALMKGALQVDELMDAVQAKEGGLQTGRLMSHIYAIDVPNYPRPLFITDAAINVSPSLEDKRDIVQNAIDLAHALNIPCPRVAILSAVEAIHPKIYSTIEAAALCKMAERGQIKGGLIDGPLAFDTAVSELAAQTKGLVSPVAGNVDILVVPDLEAGNMLAKQLQYLADAQIAGIVLGARVPIILASPTDESLARMASCALANLVVKNSR